jgi:hypothetical protein
MVVKVQLSQGIDAPGHIQGPVMLVYDETKSVFFEQETDEGLAQLMNGRPKAFFHADYEDDDEGNRQLTILGEAEWQDW